MGLPLSPTLANIFLCHHEDKWLRSCPMEFKPVYYRRYMDDCFIIFNEKSHGSKFLEYLNSKHSNIEFTAEFENNRQLAFLDCQVNRTDAGFTTSVFRKSTFTGQGLSFFSHCPFKFKLNSITTLLHRAWKICSSMTALCKELSFLVNYFQENGYPKRLVYSQIRKFIRSTQHNDLPVTTVEPKTIHASFPYLGPTSEKLRSELESITTKFFPFVKLELVFTNTLKIGSLFRYKDALPFNMRSSVIYDYCCSRCGSGRYVGSTNRPLYMRIAEHQGRSYRTGNQLKCPPHSSIREHANSCSKEVKADDFTIIGSMSDKNKHNLLILESLHICQLKPNLNDMGSAHPLVCS